MEGWLKKFEKEFLRKPGEHLLEIGITGSGKTQGLYWIVDGLISRNKDEIIVWFDSGKSSEILTLATMKPIKLLIPETYDIEVISNHKFDIEKDYFMDPKEIWNLIDEDRINIVSLYRFLMDYEVYAKCFARAFKALIVYAHMYKIPTPLAILFDEFHYLVPGRGEGESSSIQTLARNIQLNIEKLRSLEVRLVATTHGWTKIRRGVRTSFNWIIARRGANFTQQDEPKLFRFNVKFQKLQNDEAVIVYPNKIFSDIIHLPKYPDGKDLGMVKYLGFQDLLDDDFEIPFGRVVEV